MHFSTYDGFGRKSKKRTIVGLGIDRNIKKKYTSEIQKMIIFII